VAGDKLSFGGKLVRRREPSATEVSLEEIPQLPARLPSVSIVIPAKQASVAATLQALNQQAYAGVFDVILVGDIEDPALAEARKMAFLFPLTTIEVNVKTPRRDSNAKRTRGLEEANGEILAVLDSDVLPPANWLEIIVSRLTIEGYHAVAGPLSGLGDSWWDRYIDENSVASKTPRMNRPYTVTANNTHKRKLPVTANFACRREVMERAGTPDTRFTYSYEDYSWFSSIVKAGFSILCDPALITPRYHRSGLRSLLGEYKRSGMGCADFVVVHTSSRFSVKRITQVFLTLGVLLGGVITSVIEPSFLIVLAVSLAALAMMSWKKIGRIEALVYPFISLLFSVRFLQGFLIRFLRRGFREPINSYITHERVAHDHVIEYEIV
jgi:glycosyltransferase involved in cell wall biosynthesis